jgi:hypothetical protein
MEAGSWHSTLTVADDGRTDTCTRGAGIVQREWVHSACLGRSVSNAGSAVPISRRARASSSRRRWMWRVGCAAVLVLCDGGSHVNRTYYTRD